MTRNKRVALSLRCDDDGELGVASRSTIRRSLYGLHEKANTHHPPQTVKEGGARNASRPSHSASARSFRLIRRMSVGVGGLAWARFRADDRSVDATKRDPRLP